MRHLSGPRIVILFAILATVAIGGAYWLALVRSEEQLRTDALAQAGKRAQQLANAEANHVEMLLFAIDLELHQFRDAAMAGDRRALEMIADNAFGIFPKGAVINLSLIDNKGQLTYSRIAPNEKAHYGDRDYFQFHRDARADALFVTKPLLSRVSGEWVVLMSRPLLRHNRFEGVANITLSPHYFGSMLERLAMDSGDTVTLLYSDGTYMARNTGLKEVLGKAVLADRPFLARDAAAQGAFRASASADAIPRLFAWSRLTSYPLIMIIGLSESTLLAPIERQIDRNRMTNAIGTGVVILLVFLACVLMLRVARKDAALRASEEELRTVMQNTPGSIMRVDRNGRITFVNRLLPGLSQEAVIGSSVYDWVPADQAPVLDRVLREVFTHGRQTEYETSGPGPDGGQREYRVRVMPVMLMGKADTAIFDASDITDRRRLEMSLVDNEEHLRTLVATTPVGVFETDRNGKCVFVNERWSDITGLSFDAAAGDGWTSALHPEDRDKVQAEWAAAAAAGRRFNLEYRFLRPDGKVAWVLGQSDKYCSATGELLGYIGSITDITERKRAETELDNLSQRLLLATSSAKLGVWDLNVRENAIVWDQRMFELYGVTPDSFSGSVDAWTSALHPEDRERAIAEFEAALKGQKEFDTSFRVRLPGGTVRHLKANGLVLRAKDGTPERMIGINADITEQKDLEEIHLRAQKLESLGTLTGGIAHDFNNILAAIRGNADLAAEDLGPNHPVAESLAEIKKASTRAHELVRRIMAFGRPKDARLEPVNLREVADEVLKLLRPTLRAGIALQTAFPAGDVHALADAGQIHEIIVNLTTNAAYAIGSGEGSIEYRIELVSVDEDRAHAIPGLKPGSYARLTVTDTGCGMNAATMERIFDAFYTTKPAGEGVGLGLSMVHGIMQSYGGAVTVQSSPGKGSAFALYFPTASEQPAGTESERASPRSLAAGRRRVLFVDDEEALVSLAQRAISRLGHSVAGFSDPKAALEAFRAHPREFDVVVTDLSMPQMSGINLAREVLSLRPDMPVLLASGNISEAEARLVAEMGVRAVLQKPVTVSELDAILDRLFRGGDPGEKQNP